MADPTRDAAVIFEAAMAIDDSEQRRALLEVACRGNPELRENVESLLAACAEASGFLEQSPKPPVTTPEAAFHASDGPEIGRYKLLEQIGEGGFGVVYMADQLRPIQRRVALKIIKAGMDTKQVIARFEAERQALALMDHPNIARVLDAGTTDMGRPYFVMELVRGIPVTTYCDERSLSTDERLRLFVEICAAIQHAHQKGIIHRDIKPTNVLVSTNGDHPVPKVIDFGIAKATQGRLTEKTLFTQFRQFVGTPEYMSPEQAQMSTVDVDTRSDIYSLGVLLYELLTGKTPIGSQELQEVAFDEICRRIREEDAPTPSKRVSSLQQEELETLAANRRVDPADVSTLIRGDLDWIVMRAVDKDRARRYSTADALAEDILRHLTREPVSAAPPSMAYLASKFVRRNRGLLATISITATLLVIAAVTSTLLAFSAIQSRNELSEEVVAKDNAVKRAETKETEAVLAKKRLEKNLYFDRIARSLREWMTGDLARAEQLFSDCSSEYRDWEWDYLNRLFHSNRRILNAGFPVPSGEYRHVSYSPDGRFIACYRHEANNKGGELLFWNGDSGDRIPSLCPKEDGAQAVAFSRDSKRIAVAYAKPGGIGVWEIKSKKELFHARHESFSNQLAVAFDPSGDRLVSTSKRGYVHVWNLEQREHEHTLKSHRGSVFQAEFSPDGHWIASAGRDGAARIWNADTGELLHTLESGPDVRDLAFSPDGHALVTGGYFKFKQGFWDVWSLKANPPTVRSYPSYSGAVRGVSYTPDGSHVLLGQGDGTVHVCDPFTGLQIDVLHAHNTGVLLALSADGQALVTCGALDGQVKQWDLTRRLGKWKGAVIGRDDFAWTRGSALHPNLNEIAVAGGFNGTRRLSGKKTIQLWDLHDRYYPEMSREFGGNNGSLTSVVYSAAGHLIAAGSDDHIVRIWDASNGELLSEFAEHNAAVTSVLFLGQRLVSASDDHTIRIWNVGSGEARTLVGHAAGVNCIAANPDHCFAISGSEDKTVKVWNVATGQAVATLNAEQAVTSVAWSLDGRWIAAGLVDGIARAWEIENLEAMQVVHRHDLNAGAINAKVAFHPAGNRLATVSRRAKLWDVQTGQEAFSFPDDLGTSHGISFSSDGTRLLVTRHNEAVVWFADNAQPFLNRPGREEVDHILNWHRRRLGDCRVNDNWFGVSFHAGALIDSDPQNANHYSTRARAYAEREMWLEATADLVKANTLQPNLQIWIELALLHLRNGNRLAYQDVCREQLELLVGSQDAAMTLRVARSCSFGPQVNPEKIVAICEHALESAPPGRRQLPLNILGAALYRSGRFEDSIKRLQESNDAHAHGGYADGWLVLSMAHSRLGQGTEAQRWLNKAKTRIERDRVGNSPVSWARRIMLRLFIQEAEILINKTTWLRKRRSSTLAVRTRAKLTTAPWRWAKQSATTRTGQPNLRGQARVGAHVGGVRCQRSDP